MRDYDAAGSLAEELPYWGWLDDRTCLTRGGELLMIGALAPAGVDGQPAEALDRVAQLWARVLSNCSPDARVAFYAVRRPWTDESGAEALGDDDIGTVAYRTRQRFLRDRVQALRTYVVWCHDPRLRRVGRGGRTASWWFAAYLRAWLARRRVPQEAAYIERELAQRVADFRQTVDAACAMVASLTPIRLLGAAEGNAVLSDLVNRPGTPCGGNGTGSGLNWRLAVSDLEAERRHLRLDGEPVIMYSLLTPPAAATANLLQAVLCLDVSLTLALEWRPRSPESARRAIRSAQAFYFAKRYNLLAHVQEREGTAAAKLDTAADAESARLGDALVELEADGLAFGDVGLTIAVHGPLAATERYEADLRRAFAAHDAKLVRESYGQLCAWFGRLPGQSRKRLVRSVFLSAGAAACLAPVFGPPRGTPRSAHLDRPALAALETRWGTPYAYDLFAGDVGHTLILGATGSGKSFFLNFLLVQARRYDARIVILDLGGSYRWLTAFVGGGYLELAPARTDGAGPIRPFSLPPGPRTTAFLTGWIVRLLRIGGYSATGGDTNEIRARIEDLYVRPAADRRLGALVETLPDRMWPALARWHGEGAWGTDFDHAAEGAALGLDDWQVIDLAGAAEYTDWCEAALTYLLERLRLVIDDPAETGRVKLLVVDEAWRYLQDPGIAHYLSEAAKTWRKRNAALILATQSAADVSGPAGAGGLLEALPTKMFLANPDFPDAAADALQLQPAEVQTIRDLTPQRELYLRRPREAGVLRLEVDRESYWLYTSSPMDAVRRAEAVAAHGGNLRAAIGTLARGGPHEPEASEA